jgi:hypothetical protein
VTGNGLNTTPAAAMVKSGGDLFATWEDDSGQLGAWVARGLDGIGASVAGDGAAAVAPREGG